MEQNNAILIIAAYLPNNELFQAHRYSHSIGIEEAICRTLNTLFTPNTHTPELQLRCFQSPVITPNFQFFPQPNRELRMLLRNLSATHTIDALQAYWLYKNGYSPLECNLDPHISDNILCYRKLQQIIEPENTSTNQLIIRVIIGATSPQHTLDEETLMQVAQINSSRGLETCLSAIWQYLSLLPPDTAQKLLELLSPNTHFKSLILTKEFAEQFKSAGSTVQSALQLRYDELNPAHKTILAITLNCLQAKQELLKQNQAESQEGIHFGLTVMPGITQPLATHLEHIHQKLANIETQIANIHAQLYPVDSSLSNNTNSKEALSILTEHFNNKPYHLSQTIQLISQYSYLCERKEDCAQILTAFYESGCWLTDPCYAYSVQNILLNKLSQLRALPFITDLLKISSLPPEEMPDPHIFQYLEVLTHYCASSNSSELQPIREQLQKCTQHLTILAESIRKPLDFVPIFSAALSTGITAFLSQSSDSEIEQLKLATRHYGLETLLTQVQYRLTKGQDSDALVQSRYAETLLVNALTLLTQAIPQASDKKLLFKGWITGIVELRNPDQPHMHNTTPRLSTDNKSEVIHTLFANNRTGSWTETDLLLDSASNHYNGVPPTNEEVNAWKNQIDSSNSAEVPLPPAMIWLLTKNDILSKVIKLNQLHRKTQNITNLFDKDALRTEITCLTASIQSTPIIY